MFSKESGSVDAVLLRNAYMLCIPVQRTITNKQVYISKVKLIS